MSFDELVVVSDNFHVKPLMPLLTGDNLFYVLALSQKEVRLIECTAYGSGRLKLKTCRKALRRLCNMTRQLKMVNFGLLLQKEALIILLSIREVFTGQEVRIEISPAGNIAVFPHNRWGVARIFAQ